MCKTLRLTGCATNSLNLAASGSSLEKAGVQAHFTRKGMAELLARFAWRLSGR